MAIEARQGAFRNSSWPRAILAEPRKAERSGSKAMMQDSRAHPRIPTRLMGRLLSIDGRCNVNCTITDLSEGGAGVTSAEYYLIPNRVFLLVEKSGDIFECEVRRCRADGVGLSFIDSPGRACRRALLELCRAEPA